MARKTRICQCQCRPDEFSCQGQTAGEFCPRFPAAGSEAETGSIFSAYSLIIEKGTPFYELYRFDAVRQQAGMQTVALPTEDEVYRMTKLTEQVLAEAGYVHYEVSNFAKPGYACRHNIGYWGAAENYLGLGLGASSLMENIRYSNTRGIVCVSGRNQTYS